MKRSLSVGNIPYSSLISVEDAIEFLKVDKLFLEQKSSQNKDNNKLFENWMYLRRCYRKRALDVHPDKVDGSKEQFSKCEAALKTLQEAYCFKSASSSSE